MNHNFKLILMAIFVFAINTSNAQYEKRPNPTAYKSPVLKAIAYGITAPSPHNTQCWFIDTLSSNEMLLYVKHVLHEQLLHQFEIFLTTLFEHRQN